MTNPSMLRRCVASLILFAGVVFGAQPNPAAVPSNSAAIEDLLAQLDKRGATATGPEATQFAETLARVRAAVRSNRYEDAGAAVGYLRANPIGRVADSTGLLDRLQAAVEAQNEAQTRGRNAAIESIQSETAARFRAHAPTADYDTLLQRLGAIPVAPAFNNDMFQRINDLRTFISGCQDYTAALGSGDVMAANNALYNLAQVATRLEVIPRSELIALRAAAPKAVAESDPLAAQIGAWRTKVDAALDRAQSAGDLDELLQDLAKTRATVRSPFGGPQNQFDQLQRLVRRWQDFLSVLKSDAVSAQSILRELLASPDLESSYPRSKVLARLAALQSGAGQKPALMPPSDLTLATLEPFMRQLSAIPRGSPQANAIPGIDGIFARGERLRSVAAQLAAGNTQGALMLTVSQSFSPAGDYAAAFDRIDQELIGRAIAVSVEAPPEVARKPGESMIAYLERVVSYGRERQDWGLVHRVVLAEQVVAPMESRINGSVQTYLAFFTAQNAEKAGEWSQAVRFYQSALRAAGVNVPADEIGKRLAAIKAEHPNEYEQAERIPILELGGSSILPVGRSGSYPPVVRPRLRSIETPPAPVPSGDDAAAAGKR